jgi:hypothetical protein
MMSSAVHQDKLLERVMKRPLTKYPCPQSSYIPRLKDEERNVMCAVCIWPTSGKKRPKFYFQIFFLLVIIYWGKPGESAAEGLVTPRSKLYLA